MCMWHKQPMKIEGACRLVSIVACCQWHFMRLLLKCSDHKNSNFLKAKILNLQNIDPL